jgi:pimeloyl-ACP methyl ester carboxylesterase
MGPLDRRAKLPRVPNADRASFIALSFAVLVGVFGTVDADDTVLTVDHYVRHESTLPAMRGETAQLYVRERVLAGTLARTRDFADRVVLFVHGAGTPAEVAFDVPFADYSWMAYLAAAGFDVFSMDVTGYGRSTRPNVMNDPCNLAPEDRAGLATADCDPSYAGELGNIASDWDDIGAVVEYVRTLRGVDELALLGWSLGGPRAGGFAAQNPDRVSRLVLLAPAYERDRSPNPPASLPVEGAAITKQSHADFTANWERQLGCEDQYDARAAESVWQAMLASDPVGATWGTGMRRAPRTTVWGWNEGLVSRTRTPMLIVHGVHDKQVAPERGMSLYADLGSASKVYIDLGCASHNAMWERNHTLLFRASLEWLQRGTVNGVDNGILQMGYE